MRSTLTMSGALEETISKVKISILGDSGVGKSCLISVFAAILDNPTFDSFSDIIQQSQATIGCDFISRVFQLSANRTIKLSIWDTAGQEKYRAINKNFYTGSNGVLICFDLTKPLEVEAIKSWVAEAKEHIGDECIIVMVGTKGDGAVDDATVKTLTKFAAENKLDFIQTSSLLGTNVYFAFESLIKTIDKQMEGRLGAENSFLTNGNLQRKDTDVSVSISGRCC